MRKLHTFFILFAAMGASLLGACDDNLALPNATAENVVDTIQLFALRGTAISQPSGYHLPTRQVVRTDAPGFDIAFDFDDAGVPTIYPAGAFGLPREPGLLKVNTTFDEVTSAPNVDFIDHIGLATPVGTVFVAQSGLYGGDCGNLSGALPRYGKFRVLSVDTTTRSITLEVLVNVNCGDRDLRPGIRSA